MQLLVGDWSLARRQSSQAILSGRLRALQRGGTRAGVWKVGGGTSGHLDPCPLPGELSLTPHEPFVGSPNKPAGTPPPKLENNIKWNLATCRIDMPV